MVFAIASPMPMPCCLVVKKGSKIRSRMARSPSSHSGSAPSLGGPTIRPILPLRASIRKRIRRPNQHGRSTRNSWREMGKRWRRRI